MTIRGGGDTRWAMALMPSEECARRPGALPPKRMVASWSGPQRGSNRIQGCGARFARHGRLPSVRVLAASPGTTALQCVTVTEIRAMPRGREPDGEHTLSNAERQARYRARHLTQPAPVATRTRRPTDRRSRPQRWRDAVTTLLARCSPSMPIGSRRYPTACATAPRPRRSKPSPILTFLCSPISSRPEATGVIKLQRIGALLLPLTVTENSLTAKAPYKALPGCVRTRPRPRPS